MKKIASFSVDHDLIVPGIYISRVDGDVTTFDLRTRKPNGGEYMDNITMHSVEHMLATLLRNAEIGESIIYFGPMGCRTGFYLLVRNADPEKVLSVLKKGLADTVSHKGRVFGQSRKECGNYKELSAASARREAAYYLKILEDSHGFDYPENK